MVGSFIVVGERFETFKTKKGADKTARRLSLLDQAEPPLMNTIDWEPKETDAAKLPVGKVKGKVVNLGVTDIRAGFGGRYSIEAGLVADGGNAAAKP